MRGAAWCREGRAKKAAIREHMWNDPTHMGQRMYLAAYDGRLEEMVELIDGGVDLEWTEFVSNPRALPAHRPAPNHPTTHRGPAHARRLHPHAARRVCAR